MADKTTTPADEDPTLETASGETNDTPVEEAEIVEETRDEGADDTTPEAAAETDADPEPTAPAAPAPEPQIIESRRGPGFFPLLLGGVIAAALGYGAAYLGYLPGQGQDASDEAPLAALSEQLDSQTTALSALTERAAALEAQIAALPEPPAPVDLGPLTTEIGALSDQVAASGQSLQGLTDRVAYLETLPLGTGDGVDNSAAIAAAVAQMQAALAEQTASLAAQQAENAALTEQIQGVAAAAEERIAAAEARAEARVTGATAQAAFGQLQIAVATGAPFTGALADVADGAGIEVPEALQAAAESGVPTLEDLQAAFPTAARAALPIAIRETAGEGTMNRVTAFLQSQVGGRSLEPMEGDTPDAVLSRAEAAVQGGDVFGALEEISSLPGPAQEALSDWVDAAMARLAATDAMAEFAAALDAAN